MLQRIISSLLTVQVTTERLRRWASLMKRGPDGQMKRTFWRVLKVTEGVERNWRE